MRKIGLACALLLLAGCVGLPQHVIKYRSEALRSPQSTTLGRIVEDSAEGIPAQSVGHTSADARARRPSTAGSRSPIAPSARSTSSTTSFTRTNPPEYCCSTCAPPRIAACACGCWWTISTPRARTGASCIWSSTPTSTCGSSIRFPAGAPRPGAASSLRYRTYRASITACTTSCSWPITRWPSPAAAISAMSTSRATSAAISSISTWWRWGPSCRSCRHPSTPFGTASIPTRSHRSPRRCRPKRRRRRRSRRACPPKRAIGWRANSMRASCS